MNWLQEFLNGGEVRDTLSGLDSWSRQSLVLTMDEFRFNTEAMTAKPDDPLPWKFDYVENFFGNIPHTPYYYDCQDILMELNVLLNIYLLNRRSTMTSTYKAKQIIRDAAMRRALLEVLQEATKDLSYGGERWPEPMRDDDDVKRELKRILKL